MPQTLVARLTETGKIRIGRLIPKTKEPNKGAPTPEYLKTFRLTSSSRAALEQVAAKYGGTVQSWAYPPEWLKLPQIRKPDHAFEVITETAVLDVLIQPTSLMSTNFERWRGRFCVLRCDGEFIIKDAEGKLVGHPCICPSDPAERKALAKLKPPQACGDYSRIVVVLEGIRGGQWRLDTQGFNAPAETRGWQQIFEKCRVAHQVLPAQMRLEQRTETKLEQGETKVWHYSLVVIEPIHTVDQLMLAGAEQRLLVPPSIQREGKLLAEHIADIAPTAEVFDLVAQLESAVLQTKGTLEEWYGWAVQTFGKAHDAFTREDYARLLAAVRVAAQRRQSATVTAEPVEETPPAETPPPAPPMAHPSGTNGPWQANVQTLATQLLEACVELPPSPQRTEVEDACERGLRMVANPTPLATGEAMLEELRRLQDGLTGQLRLMGEG